MKNASKADIQLLLALIFRLADPEFAAEQVSASQKCGPSCKLFSSEQTGVTWCDSRHWNESGALQPPDLKTF